MQLYRRKNTGKIKIEITQGSRKNSEIVDVAKIKDNDYYYLNIRGLKPGEAVLRVEGVDGTIGNAVSMHKTADIMYSEMVQNGEPSQRAFVQKISFSEYNGTVKGQIIFTILSVLCYIYFLSLLWDEERNSRRIYVTTVLLIYLVVASRAPVLTFRVEPFAEQIFNFLYNARTYGIIKNLTLMEGGYLPLFHRIIALLIVKPGLNAKVTVYLMSNAAVLVVGLMVSVFTLKAYRKYGDVFYRFAVCMVFWGVRHIFHIYRDAYVYNDGVPEHSAAVLYKPSGFQGDEEKQIRIVNGACFCSDAVKVPVCRASADKRGSVSFHVEEAGE